MVTNYNLGFTTRIDLDILMSGTFSLLHLRFVCIIDYNIIGYIIYYKPAALPCTLPPPKKISIQGEFIVLDSSSVVAFHLQLISNYDQRRLPLYYCFIVLQINL